MLFKRRNVPPEVSAAGLSKWYSKLSDQNKVRLGRYVEGVEGKDAHSFLLECARASAADENWAFTEFLCGEALSLEPDDLQRFLVNEELIDARFFTGKYEGALAVCRENMAAYPSVSERFLELNSGKVPDKLRFRNRQVDILVGVFSDYDDAFALMDEYVAMGVLGGEEAARRKESLKIRRMQRCLDGIFCYDYKDKSKK